LPATDNRRRNIGCQPGKAQERVEVGRRHALFSSDVMHGEFGVLDKTGQNVMSPSNNPQQTRICCRTMIGSINNQHSHFATDTLKTGRNR